VAAAAAPARAARPVVRRGGWALPPQPPEHWVGAGWTAVLLAGVALAVALPVLRLLGADDDPSAAVTAAHVVAGVCTVLAAYLLLVQESVTGDLRLRWVAAGHALLLGVVLARAATLRGPGPDAGLTTDLLSRGAGAGLVWSLVLPLTVLTVGLAVRSMRLLAGLAVVVGGSTALALAAPGPVGELLEDDGAFTPALQVAGLLVAVVVVLAVLSWWRECPLGRRGPWGLVLAGLVVAAPVWPLRVLSGERYDGLWWASVVLEDLALLLPVCGLLVQGTSGYFRQARRWHQLEAEVRALRTSSALLPGRSITPEDEAGLPEEPEVRQIVDERRVKIALQPVVDLTSGAVLGHEALARFGGRTPTDRWFRAASRYGLGGELEQVTLSAALALLPGLPAEQYLAVNVSPAALTDDVVISLLHASDLRRIVVEVTEHEAVADYPLARTALDRLRAAGARIAVDDTGAGFASLRHVLLLQPDVIKLDMSITRDVETDKRQRALITAILRFAREVGSEVLAEGVETEPQLQVLKEIGVPVGQGWHLGVPEIQEP
jgi:EAL domain-containing protein (putative c-di-GMP-specific phosphodiesterase class I)